MAVYTLVTSGVYLVLGLSWSVTGWLNFTIKCALFGLGVWGLFLRFGVQP